jgi:hypothetical protein
MTDRTMTLAEAAREARMDRQTVRRRLKAAGVDIEDYRDGGPTGTIRIPTPVLSAAGVPIGRPSPPDEPAQVSAQVETLAEVERLKARAQVAEAKVEALERLIEAKQDTIDAQAQALRMLGPGEPRSRWRRR